MRTRIIIEHSKECMKENGGKPQWHLPCNGTLNRDAIGRKQKRGNWHNWLRATCNSTIDCPAVALVSVEDIADTIPVSKK